MARKSERNLIVGLDIGTSKVAAIVGELSSDGSIEVIGIGTTASRGLKKGVVVNLESTVQSIQRAIEEAELTAGIEIRNVCVGLSGIGVGVALLTGRAHVRSGWLPRLAGA